MFSINAAAMGFAPVANLGATMQHAAAAIQMRTDDTFAPAGMGKEYVSRPRKPLSEYAGASFEMDVASYFRGQAPVAWDPMQLSELYKVSGNNPDVAWLREAELKHGRVAMLAFAGILVQGGGVHLPAEWAAGKSNWVTAPADVAAVNPAAIWQVVFAIAFVEGVTCKGIFDMWFGITDIREPGDIGFDPLGLMPKDAAAAEKMKTKELKNGRMAMIGVMAFCFNAVIPGAAPGL